MRTKEAENRVPFCVITSDEGLTASNRWDLWNRHCMYVSTYLYMYGMNVNLYAPTFGVTFNYSNLIVNWWNSFFSFSFFFRSGNLHIFVFCIIYIHIYIFFALYNIRTHICMLYYIYMLVYMYVSTYASMYVYKICLSFNSSSSFNYSTC